MQKEFLAPRVCTPALGHKSTGEIRLGSHVESGTFSVPGTCNPQAKALPGAGPVHLSLFYRAACTSACPPVMHGRTCLAGRSSQQELLIQARNGRYSLEEATA